MVKKNLYLKKNESVPEEKPVKKVRLEINTERVEESIAQISEKIAYWYRQGIIHKVRLKHKGKPILPDIPLSYFMLVQVATFFLSGIIRALALNLGARIFFEVEMINDAEERFKKARDFYLDGELDEAVRMLHEVLDLDRNYAEAYLYLGIIYKIRKEYDLAYENFAKAQKLNPSGKIGVEAAKNIKKLMPPG